MNSGTPPPATVSGTPRWPRRVKTCALVAAVLFALCIAAVALRVHHTNAWIALAQRDALPLDRLPQRLREQRIVIAGESHALVEPLDTIRLLLSNRDAAFTDIVLEWSDTDQPAVDRYLAGDDSVLDQFRRDYGQLPGATEDYWALLTFIRDHNRDDPDRTIGVLLADVPHPIRDSAEENRNLYMFNHIQRLIDAGPQRRILIYVGANHAAKTGSVEYIAADGRSVPLQLLGARLRDRYSTEVASIKILAPADRMWNALQEHNAFAMPVAIPLTSEWPDPNSLFSFWHWQSNATTADAVYDYAVWWPTSRLAKRSAPLAGN